jgi:hypothetical protein
VSSLYLEARAVCVGSETRRGGICMRRGGRRGGQNGGGGVTTCPGPGVFLVW